ncbi:MAG: hypothetical protein EOP11_01995 [Proteobacteria bacterium]|nr:MAG: hypothetical protein EOP11_01995 [Pseudomonadota bacterium]
MKKILLAFSISLSLLTSQLALAQSYTAKQDQHLSNNEDRYLTVEDGSYMLSPSEPQSLVYREQGGEGSTYERFSVVTETDLEILRQLKPGTNYDCKFEDTAIYRYGMLPSSYRRLAFGVTCMEK